VAPSTRPFAWTGFVFIQRAPGRGRLTRLGSRRAMRSIERLYVESLLLGHHPLRWRELQLLNRGLISLLEWGVATEKRQGGSNG
jgi:molecular chaperone HtpG